MKKGKILVIFLTIFAVLCLLGGCAQDSGSSSTPAPAPAPVETTGSIKIENKHLLYIIEWAGIFNENWSKIQETANRENIDVGASKTFSRLNPGIYNVKVTDENGNEYQTSTVTTVRAGETSVVTFTARGLANN